MLNCCPLGQRRAGEAGIGADPQCALLKIGVETAGQHFERTGTVAPGKLLGIPARRAAFFLRLDPYLEQPGFLIAEIVFAVLDSGTCAHHLDIAGQGMAFIANRIAMGDRALPDIGDNLHVRVRMGWKTALGGDFIVVPDAQGSPAHPGRIVITAEGEMVAGVEPAMIGMAEA